jgi:hypothetical protein
VHPNDASLLAYDRVELASLFDKSGLEIIVVCMLHLELQLKIDSRQSVPERL